MAATEESARAGADESYPSIDDLKAQPLLQRVVDAMAEAGEVTKDQENKDQHYKFASVESILAAIRMPLLRRYVLLKVQPKVYEAREIRAKSGTLGTGLTITVDFTFTDAFDDAKTFSVTDWRGDGEDYGDKAYGKAYTNALKTFIRCEWLLPTPGDDPERDSHEKVAGGAQLPPWAAEASDARKHELLDLLAPVIGRPRAMSTAKATAETFGHLPDCIVGYTKALAAHCEAVRQDRAAERPDEASDRDPGDASRPDVDERPVAGDVEGDAHDPESEQAADPAVPEFPAGTVPDGDARAAEVCVCPQGLDTPDGDRRDDCPVEGHGIPF